MRVAVTAKNAEGLDSLIDPVFGRAAVFLVLELEARTIRAEIDNPFTDYGQGAGTGAATLMHREQVDAVISGQFGPKAYQAMTHFGIEMWNVPAGITAREALDRFQRGELQQMKIERY